MLRTRLLAALPYHVITRPISTMANPPRFHPLSPSAPPSSAPKLQGIIFDMDGTLTLPQPWMFSRMRTALGIPDGADILAHVAAIPGDQERADAMALVETVECEAMHGMKPSPGVKELMEYLDTRGIRRAVLTRNYESAKPLRPPPPHRR